MGWGVGCRIDTGIRKGTGTRRGCWDLGGTLGPMGAQGLRAGTVGGGGTGTHGGQAAKAQWSTQAPSSSPTLGAGGGCGRVWGGPEGVVGLGARSCSWGAPPRMSPFSCRLWSGGRLTMKRLSLLFTRFFSKASGPWGAPGGTAGSGHGHGHSHASPEACSPPRSPNPTWSPGPLSDPRRLILVPAELHQVPNIPPVQPPHRCMHGVLQVLGRGGGGGQGQLGMLTGLGAAMGQPLPPLQALTSRRMTPRMARAHSWMVASWSDCSRNSLPVTVRS